MFTGLIREIATSEISNSILVIKSNYKPNIGDSIAINGVCLTVTEIFNNGFCVDISDETANVVAIKNYNGEVNVEPAMKMGDRIEGHLLQGHIDALATVVDIINNEHSVDYILNIPIEFMKFIVPKGSIAVDGVSLTVNDSLSNSFRLTIIKHTLKNSIIKNYKIGQMVNIETDMFARYVYHIFKKDINLQEEFDLINNMY